jgi:outer membrane protein assembly factor BamB
MLAWREELGAAISRAPQVQPGRIYLASKDGRITALSAGDGVVLWSYPSSRRIWDLSLTASADAVYVGLEGGDLLCLNAGDGTVRWTRELGINVTYPAREQGGTVYVPSAHVGTDLPSNFEGKARLFAVAAEDGHLLWEAEMNTFILTQPYIVDDTVYVGGPTLAVPDDVEGGHTRVYALREEDGTVLWETVVAAGLVKNLRVERGVVTLLGYRDVLLGLDASTGDLAWEFGTGNWAESFTTGGGLVYFGSATSVVQAVDVTTGRESWTRPLAGAFNYIVGEPSLSEGRLYFITTLSQVIALDAVSGEIQWALDTDIVARAPLATDRERVFIASNEGSVYTYLLP